MSALAGRSWPTRTSDTVAAKPGLETRQGNSIRRRIDAIRDTLIVLGIQLVFRAMLALRRWNY